MSGLQAPGARGELTERYVARIEAHLVRLRDGHDPMGHLFAIERLARVARAEWRAEQRSLDRERRWP